MLADKIPLSKFISRNVTMGIERNNLKSNLKAWVNSSLLTFRHSEAVCYFSLFGSLLHSPALPTPNLFSYLKRGIHQHGW